MTAVIEFVLFPAFAAAEFPGLLLLPPFWLFSIMWLGVLVWAPLVLLAFCGHHAFGLQWPSPPRDFMSLIGIAFWVMALVYTAWCMYTFIG